MSCMWRLRVPRACAIPAGHAGRPCCVWVGGWVCERGVCTHYLHSPLANTHSPSSCSVKKHKGEWKDYTKIALSESAVRKD